MEETQRTALLDLARERSMRFVGLFLTANLATRLARIAHREHDASDATPDVALKQETFVIGDMDWSMLLARQKIRCAVAPPVSPKLMGASVNGGTPSHRV